VSLHVAHAWVGSLGQAKMGERREEEEEVPKMEGRRTALEVDLADELPVSAEGSRIVFRCPRAPVTRGGQGRGPERPARPGITSPEAAKDESR
jgi:hypothetical protein